MKTRTKTRLDLVIRRREWGAGFFASALASVFALFLTDNQLILGVALGLFVVTGNSYFTHCGRVDGWDIRSHAFFISEDECEDEDE